MLHDQSFVAFLIKPFRTRFNVYILCASVTFNQQRFYWLKGSVCASGAQCLHKHEAEKVSIILTWSMRVNLLSLYGTWLFPSLKALMTLLRASKPRLMFMPSFRRCPSALVRFALSLPAKSTCSHAVIKKKALSQSLCQITETTLQDAHREVTCHAITQADKRSKDLCIRFKEHSLHVARALPGASLHRGSHQPAHHLHLPPPAQRHCSTLLQGHKSTIMGKAQLSEYIQIPHLFPHIQKASVGKMPQRAERVPPH